MNRGARTVELNPILSQVSFTEFLDQVQDGLYVVDAERRIVFWNRAAEQLSGFAARDMAGKRCADVLGHTTIGGESLCHDETCPLLRCMRSSIGGMVPHIILMNTASGKPLPISLSVGPLRDHGGESIGAIALFRGMREEYQQRKLAVEIQKRTITQGGFAHHGVRVQTLYAPLDELGGDFLEAFFLDERTLIATVADATGHGISASLFAMAYKTLLHASFAGHRDPGMVLESVNKAFLETAGVDGFYVEACLVLYDTISRKGTFAAAGHPPGLVFTPDGEGFRLNDTLGAQSLMLGMDERAEFGEIAFSLAEGEFLLLTTDGMLESPCRGGAQFGVKGIEGFFSRYRGTAPLEDLLAECRRCSAFDPMSDDVSALLIAPS